MRFSPQQGYQPKLANVILKSSTVMIFVACALNVFQNRGLDWQYSICGSFIRISTAFVSICYSSTFMRYWLKCCPWQQYTAISFYYTALQIFFWSTQLMSMIIFHVFLAAEFESEISFSMFPVTLWCIGHLIWLEQSWEGYWNVIIGVVRIADITRIKLLLLFISYSLAADAIQSRLIDHLCMMIAVIPGI